MSCCVCSFGVYCGQSCVVQDMSYCFVFFFFFICVIERVGNKPNAQLINCRHFVFWE